MQDVSVNLLQSEKRFLNINDDFNAKNKLDYPFYYPPSTHNTGILSVYNKPFSTTETLPPAVKLEFDI